MNVSPVIRDMEDRLYDLRELPDYAFRRMVLCQMVTYWFYPEGLGKFRPDDRWSVIFAEPISERTFIQLAAYNGIPGAYEAWRSHG